MNVRKSIGFAYPTSYTATKLGRGDTGCWIVAQSKQRKDGTWSAPYLAAQDSFGEHELGDLIATYRAAGGEPCPMFLAYGEPRILAAIAGRHHE